MFFINCQSISDKPDSSIFSLQSFFAPLKQYVILRAKVVANPKSNNAVMAPMLQKTYHSPNKFSSK